MPAILFRRPFNQYELTLIPTWISNYMLKCGMKLSIPKLQWCNQWSLGMDELFQFTHYNGYNYLSMWGLKLNHVSKRTLMCSYTGTCIKWPVFCGRRLLSKFKVIFPKGNEPELVQKMAWHKTIIYMYMYIGSLSLNSNWQNYMTLINK